MSVFPDLFIGVIACIGFSMYKIYCARSIVRDGIEINSGRHLFKGKKKKNKKYPNRFRTFFLIDYMKYVDRGQYMIFLMSIVIWFILCLLVCSAAVKGSSSVLVDVFVVLFLLEYVLSGWVIELIGPKKKK